MNGDAEVGGTGGAPEICGGGTAAVADDMTTTDDGDEDGGLLGRALRNLATMSGGGGVLEREKNKKLN